jgi:hypothetical protein
VLKKIAMACALALFAAGLRAVTVSMVYSNAIEDEHPQQLLRVGHWKANPSARFVKLHAYLDQPVTIQRVEIESCKVPFNGLSLFANFDERYIFADPSAPVLDGKTQYEVKGNAMVFNFGKPLEVRSLTFNFEQTKGVEICGLKIFAPDGAPVPLKASDVVGGSVEANSVLEPVSAYEPMALFDSRFEYGWATKALTVGAQVAFHFDEAQKIDKLRIWAGYQRSLVHCQENSRPKTLQVDAGGTRFELGVADQLGSQVLEFPQPVEARDLTLTVTSAYLGKTYRDLVISELRFGDGDRWFGLDPMVKFKRDTVANREAFGQVGLGDVLDDGFVNRGSFYKKVGAEEATDQDLEVRLRLRSDGSFYAQVATPEEKFFSLGNYEVKGSPKGGPIKLRLFGLVHQTAVYGDCNGCGRDCNKAQDDDDDAPGQYIFSTVVELSRAPDGHLMYKRLSGHFLFDKLDFEREGSESEAFVDQRHRHIGAK